MKPAGLVIALLLLCLAAPATAQEVVVATLCGPSECRPVDDAATLAALQRTGPVRPPPARASAWYRAAVTVDRAGVRERLSLTVVPAARAFRSDVRVRGRYVWRRLGAGATAGLRRTARGVTPFPAADLRGLATPASRARSPEEPASDSDVPWLWIALGVGALLLAAAAFALRDRFDLRLPALGGAKRAESVSPPGPAIVLEGVSKRYRMRRIGPIPVPSLLPKRWRRRERTDTRGPGGESVDDEFEDEEEEEEEVLEIPPEAEKEIWALRDISLEVPAGTTLGIVGPNGAGKTTLLKLLARLTPPTTGRITIRGRVAPLIEMASAFIQPDSTGKENVHLLAELFGVPRSEAMPRVDAVIEFAGLENVANEQAKTYSSGSLRRLAFSTVLNLEPDVIVADEVLAVGDVRFKERCLQRVEEASRKGLTVLFASHDMEMVRRLCREAIWIEGGRIVQRGSAEEITRAYEGTADTGGAVAVPPAATDRQPAAADAVPEAAGRKPSPPPAPRGRESAHVSVAAAGLYSMTGHPISAMRVDEDALLEIALDARTPKAVLRCVVVLTGDRLERLRIAQPKGFKVEEPGRYTASVHLPAGLVPDGHYAARIGAWIDVNGERSSVLRPEALSFDAYDASGGDDDADEEDEAEATAERANARLAWAVTRD